MHCGCIKFIPAQNCIIGISDGVVVNLVIVLRLIAKVESICSTMADNNQMNLRGQRGVGPYVNEGNCVRLAQSLAHHMLVDRNLTRGWTLRSSKPSVEPLMIHAEL